MLFHELEVMLMQDSSNIMGFDFGAYRLCAGAVL